MLIIATLWMGIAAAGEVAWPTPMLDQRLVGRGVAAVALDPAAVGTVDDAELQFDASSSGGNKGARFGLFGVIPAGPGAVGVGYENLHFAARDYHRASAVVATPVTQGLNLGVAYRFLYQAQAGRGGSLWDLSVLSEPNPWLALSLGVEAINSPAIAGERWGRGYRAGIFVRPWGGASFLTMGGDTRLDFADGKLADAHVLADLAIVDGAHVVAGYTFDDRAIWAGLRILLGGMEIVGAAAPSTAIYGAATIRGQARESLALTATKNIEVVLDGDLRGQDGEFPWDEPRISTVALRLEEMAFDPAVHTVVVSIGKLSVGMATVEELRSAIKHLRAVGKKVVVELGYGNEKTFMVACAADHIRADNSATFDFNGFAIAREFWAGTLADLGVRFDVVAIGKFKTGADVLARTESRSEEREVMQNLVGQNAARFRHILTDERKLSVSQVDDILARGLFTAVEAKTVGLVDELTQPSDVGAAPVGRPIGEVWQEHSARARRWGPSPEIRVVPIKGTIVTRRRDQILPGDATEVQAVVAALEEARNEDGVAGVVLRIESPGGDVIAADMIWRAVRHFAEVKPIVASMGDVAASGGYYVAAPTNLIFVQPDTVTGSIGIFSVKPDVSALAKKVDLHVEFYQNGPHAGWDSIFRPLEDADRVRLTRNLQAYYETFVAKVAVGRKLSEDRVRELAQGRIYSGDEALAVGLADRIGTLHDAIEEIRDRAGLRPDVDVRVVVPKAPFSLTRTLAQLALAANVQKGHIIDEFAERLSAMEGKVWALWPVPAEVRW